MNCIIYLPYRDAYFLNEYGYAVRDLQIIHEIESLNAFDKSVIVNRPVSFVERLLGRKKKHNSKFQNIKTIDTMSFSISGPLQGRSWTRFCYNKVMGELIERLVSDGFSKIYILDFSPFAILDISRFAAFRDKLFLWHDMIDNFSKHNRYNEKEKGLVRDKYSFVSQNYDFVTAVSPAALEALDHKNSMVLPNGIFGEISNNYNSCNIQYDFGFIGFITDKFNVDIVREIISNGYTVAIYGACLDLSIQRELINSGAVLKGKFRHSELPEIISSFKVGLLPYHPEKSHDGSPLKLYEYFKYNRPCLSIEEYEVSSPYFHLVKENRLSEILKIAISQSGDKGISSSIPADWVLKNKISRILTTIT